MSSDTKTASSSHSETARRALEEVCSGKNLGGIADVYHPAFVDHVNALEYHGHEGARRSVALYLELFDDLGFVVDEQVTEGDRVASRWTLQGTHRGRRVTLNGIVISRFEDGRIVEDWAASDTIAIVRQLGLWRSLLLLVKHHRLLRDPTGSAAAPDRNLAMLTRVRRTAADAGSRLLSILPARRSCPIPADPNEANAVSTEVHHPIFARWFDRMAAKAEDQGAGEHRGRLLTGLSGRVIEVGAGNGLNFPHYPSTVTEVVAVEPEHYLRAKAEEAAATAAIDVTVVDGLAERLPAEEASFDAAVVSLVLCSVPDQATALAEVRRVLRPGGELRFYEHVVAEERRLTGIQNAVAWFWPWLGGGCHPNRDTVGAIEGAGFAIERSERFRFQPSPLMIPVAPHVIGKAVRT